MTKQSTLKVALSVVILLFIIIVSCKKQLHVDESTDELPTDIQWAKDYYTNTLQPKEGNQVLTLSKLHTANANDPLSTKAIMKSIFVGTGLRWKKRPIYFCRSPFEIFKENRIDC